ncbi:MAG: hypothetical protein K5905_24300 [Roseibium sp.]|uniref:hypothetical protein n=1 Tax=Roseibium sp. TaxID=1936156 RepID=UPI00262CD528|nr:hypothetical protein [Roseibium sp.]MCV0428591.1 hypothetical protein [Roseibium sp.]
MFKPPRSSTGWPQAHTRSGARLSQEITERLDVYPRSRGRVLRHLGEDIERACETLPDFSGLNG